MDSKIIAKLRQVLGLSKKYTDEKVSETKQYVDEKFAALPVPEPVVIQVDDIAAQVVAMLPQPKKLKAKKKNLVVNTVSPEDVMAMITSCLKDINTEYQKTGDTIIINEAPQRVVEYIREIVTEKGGEVDYTLIFKELEKQVHRMRETMVVGSSNSLRGLIDADLTGVPQNERGTYMLGQIGGDATQTFEKVSKNLDSYPATLSYVGENLATIEYDLGGGLSILKTLNYTGENLTSVVLSGDTPSGISLTKTLTYTGENLTGVNYS